MVLVSKQPHIFPMAEDIRHECGAYQLQSVIRAFGKDAQVEDLYLNDLFRKHDVSLPSFMPRILGRFGVDSDVHFWTKRKFKDRLAEAIHEDKPTLFVINSIWGDGNWHWISSWGHEETPDALEFMSYDSQLPTAVNTPGNARYAHQVIEEVLPWRGSFAVTIKE